MVAGEDIVQHRHAPEELDILEGPAQAPGGPAIRRQTHQFPAGHEDAAGGGRDQAVDQIEAGGLAGAVGADETQNLPRLHGKRDAVHGLNPAEVLGQVIDG